ncbi:hypothetical protein [Stenomitos frigidus]|uniref:Uncharacterized protein n=1 Tax=Stenomitos frigidus ULC18 TaxID=2107698 RepID=A0A2T1EB23_9CYAN|nr:hypothetical protein [Stenomitos frigidus]PSB29911.1 hypothetical protein C7B82_10180 [Stenomitos frigidus ULC18]
MLSCELTEDDYAALHPYQHERLRSRFPDALSTAIMTTTLEEQLLIRTDNHAAIDALGRHWGELIELTYIATGCQSIAVYLHGREVFSHVAVLQWQQTAAEVGLMAVAERQQTKATPRQTTAVKRMEKAAAAVVEAAPTRTINDVVQELTDMIAALAIAKVEARSPSLVNGLIAQDQIAHAPEQTAAPELVSDAPTKLPKVRLQGLYIPIKGNWGTCAKRYLKAVDPKGDAAKALKEIVQETPTGLAHMERAVREFPEADRAIAKTRLRLAFNKLQDERSKA